MPGLSGPGSRPEPEVHRESWSRNGEVSAPAEAKGLFVGWHALWRLSPAMTWSEAGERPWMKYPAVSFAAAVRPSPRSGDGRT